MKSHDSSTVKKAKSIRRPEEAYQDYFRVGSFSRRSIQPSTLPIPMAFCAYYYIFTLWTIATSFKPTRSIQKCHRKHGFHPLPVRIIQFLAGDLYKGWIVTLPGRGSIPSDSTCSMLCRQWPMATGSLPNWHGGVGRWGTWLRMMATRRHKHGCISIEGWFLVQSSHEQAQNLQFKPLGVVWPLSKHLSIICPNRTMGAGWWRSAWRQPARWDLPVLSCAPGM